MESIITPNQLERLLQKHRTPLYYYSKKVLIDTINELKHAFPIKNFQLLFATMANDNYNFLSTIRENKVGACINSIKHLELVLNCGFEREQIQFTSTGIKPEDLKKLQEEKITVNFDSLSQLQSYLALANGSKAGLRVNTKSICKEVDLEDRLGLEVSDVARAIKLAKECDSKITGLHIYVGTNYKSHVQMMPAIHSFLALAERVPDLEYVNIGGGIGVNYLNEEDRFDIRSYGLEICKLVETLSRKKRQTIQLVFEPGRRLAAESGVFVTRITDLKQLNGQRYIVIDGSIAIFPRPFHHPDSPHKALFPFVTKNQSLIDSIIVGKTTFSKDIFLRTQAPMELQIGDVVIFEKAGAYCDSMRSRFLGQNEPLNILADEYD